MEERLGEMRKGRRERIEKGSDCFFKSSGYDKLELKHIYIYIYTDSNTNHLTPILFHMQGNYK